ncbi:MAG: hypothetical protein HUU37_11070 [Bdellovibrionales bacterium]|nr:hypothetical protein [Bdellovibrionales bacterium]
MKKTILAALALSLISISGFAGTETLTLESLQKPKAHWGWGGVCRNGYYWCSLWQPAPMGASCFCNIPGYGTFWGWVTHY